MKVICKSIENPEKEEFLKKTSGLTLERVYQVLCILVSLNGKTLIRLICDDGFTPAIYDLRQFQIVSPTIPSNWIVASLPKGGIEFTCAAWADVGYWEKYFDRDPVAVRIFEEERSKIIAIDP